MPRYVDYAEYYDHDHVMTEDIPFYLGYADETGGPNWSSPAAPAGP